MGMKTKREKDTKKGKKQKKKFSNGRTQ